MKTMKAKIKELYKNYIDTHERTPFLFPSDVTYPTIEGNTSNFITDYVTNHAALDRYFVMNFGERTYNSLFANPDTLSGLFTEWKTDISSVLSVYIESWARLYYALNLDYNPLYNVDGTTETTYSQKQLTDTMGARSESDVIASRDRSDIMGARSETESIGQKEITNGTRSDTSTDYSVSYDSATEKETGKSVDAIGQQIVTEGAQSNGHTSATYTDRHTEEAHTDTHSALGYTDTHTTGQHTETVRRFGNIGVTKSSELLESEFEIRKRNFFHEIFVILSNEMGVYYEC